MARLKNPPVYFTIAALQHNRVAAIADYMPRIQDALRKEGWTGYNEVKPNNIELQIGDQKLVQESDRQWIVHNPDRTASYVFGHEVFAFQTSDYADKVQFLEDFQRGLQFLHDAVQLAEVKRVGMRMLDAIRPRASETLNQYVHAALLGFPEALSETGFTVKKGFMEHEFANDNCLIVTRLVRLSGKLALPMDLASVPFAVPARFNVTDEGSYAVLDVDSGSMPGQIRGYVEQEVMDELTVHKANLAKVFIAATTEHARKVWNE